MYNQFQVNQIYFSFFHSTYFNYTSFNSSYFHSNFFLFLFSIFYLKIVNILLFDSNRTPSTTVWESQSYKTCLKVEMPIFTTDLVYHFHLISIYTPNICYCSTDSNNNYLDFCWRWILKYFQVAQKKFKWDISGVIWIRIVVRVHQYNPFAVSKIRKLSLQLIK